MGVHWCGWCGNMSSGGMCDYENRNCQKEYAELENKFKALVSKEAFEMHVKLSNARGNTE